MKPIKERLPDVNIVAIDYDPGATQVNQENRLKLMLANARDAQQPAEPEKAEVKTPALTH
jgi:predicted nucleotide-binding protein (sugar kinase/HSP70/actin superfamily)